MSTPTPTWAPADLLPHRAPFLFVTNILQLGDGSASTEWHVTGTEEWLRGHFPGNPLVPGVLLTEALAQTAGLALGTVGQSLDAERRSGALVRVELRFDAPVRPPASIKMDARRTGGLGSLHQFDVVATHNAQQVARGSLVLSIPALTGAR